MMGFAHTHITAAPTAVANGYVTSVAMADAKTYALAANNPPYGARNVTMTRTVVDAADTPGVITVTGQDAGGSTITEVITPGATGVLVTGKMFFRSVSSIVGTGWVLGAAGADTIVIGWNALNAVATGDGVLRGLIVNTTAAGTITVSDSSGTIAVLASNTAVGYYGPYDVAWTGFLRVESAAASDVTVVHSGSLPTNYAMS